MKEYMTFSVYTRRWNRRDTYRIAKIVTGWEIRHIAHSGDCDKSGVPHLFGNFRQDSISHPSDVGDYMERLWMEMDAKHISDGEAQEKLQEIADWVSSCEQEVPLWSGWNC